MAIRTSIRLECDNPRCRNFIEGFDGNDAQFNALKDQWWILQRQNEFGKYSTWWFCRAKCAKDFFKALRKDEIAAANKEKQAKEIEEAIIISQGDQLEMGESDAQDALGGE